MHHYISAFLVGIHILWPADAPGYMNFRTKFVTFSLTVSLVQVIHQKRFSKFQFESTILISQKIFQGFHF